MRQPPRMLGKKSSRAHVRRSGLLSFVVSGAVVGASVFVLSHKLAPSGQAVRNTAPPPTAPKSALPADDVVKAGIESLTATAGDQSILVSWARVLAAGTGAPSVPSSAAPRLKYVVATATPSLANGKSPQKSCASTGAHCVIAGLENGVTYAVEVHVETSNGRVSPSRMVQATPRPESLVSSAVLWLDGSDGSSFSNVDGSPVAMGSPVAVWSDKSGHMNDGTQLNAAAQPTLVARPNGGYALMLRGSQYMTLNGSRAPDGNQLANGVQLPSGSTTSTVFIVAAQDDPAPGSSCYHNLLAWGTNQRTQGRVVHKGCRTSLAYGETYDTWQLQRPTLSWPIGKPAELTVTTSRASVAVRMNGVDSYTWLAPATAQTNTVPDSEANIGGAPWGHDEGWVGRLFELIVVSGDIPPAKRDSIEKYLITKYGLTPVKATP